MISVCMTTYNGEKYVYKQLESIVKQSVLPDEVIIVDDKSKDDTFRIINEFAKRHPEIEWKIFQNEKNVGWKINFKKAILLSRGEIIFLADQDDYWDKNKIKIMSEMLKQSGEIMVLASGFQMVNAEDLEDEPSDIISGLEVGTPVKESFTNHFYMNHHPGCCMAFRGIIREWFEKSSWNENQAHDEYIWCIALLYGGAYVIDTKLFYFLRHSTSATAKEKHTRNRQISVLNDRLLCTEVVKTIIDSNDDITEKEYKYKLVNSAKIFIEERLVFLKKRTLKSFLTLLRNIDKYEKRSFFIADIVSAVK